MRVRSIDWDAYIRRRNRPLAERIKELREIFDISQEHLAHLLGVSWTSVSRWEQGHRRPTQASGRLLAALERASCDQDLVLRVRSPVIRDPLAILRDVFAAITSGRPEPPPTAAAQSRRPARSG